MRKLHQTTSMSDETDHDKKSIKGNERRLGGIIVMGELFQEHLYSAFPFMPPHQQNSVRNDVLSS